ncbi:3-oxoacyl-[acyl-carrier-protein] synthase III C-terminal domain-containing protein [Enterovibrio paralichthyis]|uniref:3-oxoacyl-[acyl-carrier-protein] synthase III C-terminal domain-containing protein n=1 Tax=Enterovibrio paralichthyis TaxID=2853805 RepID=UPI001C4944EA|nr:3-oxoacyl-ACP synthase III family protein [Enterovibrio paralichthyis]MBV7298364.1 3-oxoacyl-ACP synthase III family protein [Enterovibrio paralichthyis]
MTIYINQCQHYLPNGAVDNTLLAQRFGLNADWISLFLGNTSRYFATDLVSGEVKKSLCDIATEAAQEVMQKELLTSEDLDFIVLSTATPDQLMPATVNLVAERLGAKNVPTFQLQSGCTGAMQAISLARSLLLSGEYKRGLVIGADVCSKFIDPTKDYAQSDANEQINFALFGDGAGALIMSTQPTGLGWEITQFSCRFTGLELPPGQIVNWRGLRETDDVMLMEDYKAIEAHVPKLAAEMLDNLWTAAASEGNEIDWYLPPQLSGRMTHHIVNELGLSRDKVINCVHETGNNGNALPFVQLSYLRDRMEDKQSAMLIAIESSKWIQAGMLIRKEAV